jgi:hypothetical protein
VIWERGGAAKARCAFCKTKALALERKKDPESARPRRRRRARS